MAEQERRTKAERREEKRQRRQEEEAAAAAAARRARLRNGAVAVSLVAVLGVLTYLAVGNLTPTIDDALTVAEADLEEARATSGCEVLDITPIESAEHYDVSTAPPEEVLYTQGRPTATGPHYEQPGPIFSGVRDQQLDERATTHNLEHGSVIIWFDPEQVSDEDVAAIDDLVVTLNDAGFDDNPGRAGILASPYTDPGIDSGKAIAIRSWAQGMDCDSWDADYAYGWIAQTFGSRGPAPEGPVAPYPEDVLEISDQAGGDGGADDGETETDDTETETDAGTDSDADSDADTDTDSGGG